MPCTRATFAAELQNASLASQGFPSHLASFQRSCANALSVVGMPCEHVSGVDWGGVWSPGPRVESHLEPCSPRRAGCARQPQPSTGAHVFVLVHGFQGQAFDMRLVKNNISLLFPRAMYLCSTANEKDTEACGTPASGGPAASRAAIRSGAETRACADPWGAVG